MPSNDALLYASTKEYTSDGAVLYLAAHQRGTPVFEARIRGDNGPIFATQEVDEFALEISAKVCLLVDDDDNIGTTRAVIRPYVPDLKAIFNMFASTSTFAGGVSTFTVNTTDDFEQVYDTATGETIGIFKHDIVVPDGEDVYCYTVKMQEETAPNVWSEVALETANGEVCRVHVYLLGLPTNDYERDLKMELKSACSSGVSFDATVLGLPEFVLPLFVGPPESTTATGALTADGAIGTTFLNAMNGEGATRGRYDIMLGDTLFVAKIVVEAPGNDIGWVVGLDFVSKDKIPIFPVQTEFDIDMLCTQGEAMTAQVVVPVDDAAEDTFEATFYATYPNNPQWIHSDGVRVQYSRALTTDTQVIFWSAKPIILTNNESMEGEYENAIVVYTPEGSELNVKLPLPE
jgi:hypothetical protein